MARNSSPLPVVLATDENYAAPCAVVMESLLQNTCRPSSFVFFILGSDLERETRDKLTAVGEGHGADIELRTPDMERLQELPLREGFSADAYNKLFAPNELQEFSRVLYLDCDVLVERDVRPLFSVDLDGHTAAAVPNGPAPFIAEFNERHGFSEDDPVFNSGVLLIHPERWARKNVAERVARWISDNRDQLIYRDQDGINVILHGDIKSLSPQWNMEARHYREWWMGLSDWWSRKAKGKELVTHYTGSRKPWKRWTYVPRQRKYRTYLRATPFSSSEWMSRSRTTFEVSRLGGGIRLVISAGRLRTGRLVQQTPKAL
ncbi:glycosyltransferase family 8 protein [Salinibacter altiplanensis]|uniref:glycosyltransferase family 8 protein n=1 Tax=Salinibacter altiplanensis TaxID=1803181 RepID=UPI000C9FA167|nr:glycosyltransferase family 8 protein [Salinibacter altiplanensis]